MAKVSLLIAARNERHLPRMVAHLLARLTGDYEILVGFDGPPYVVFPEHERLFMFAFGQRGLKPTINHLAERAAGKYLLKFDSHCAVSEGIDEALQVGMAPHHMVVPRFYTLDEATWAPNYSKRFNDYWTVGCPLTDPKGYRFQAGGYWFERTVERLHIDPLDESLTHHGSCWFVERDFFLNKLGGMQVAGYGVNYMEPADLGFRTWLAGGKVMVNKSAWYSHLHTSHTQRGYPIDWPEVKRSYRWTAEHWLRNPEFGKLVDRFWPMPTWPDNWRELQREHELRHPEWAFAAA